MKVSRIELDRALKQLAGEYRFESRPKVADAIEELRKERTSVGRLATILEAAWSK